MTCPNCGLINPDSALECDCGYDFAAKRLAARRVRAERKVDSPPGWLEQPRSETWKLVMSFIYVVGVFGFGAMAIFLSVFWFGRVLIDLANLNELFWFVLTLLIVMAIAGVSFILSRPSKRKTRWYRSSR